MAKMHVERVPRNWTQLPQGERPFSPEERDIIVRIRNECARAVCAECALVPNAIRVIFRFLVKHGIVRAPGCRTFLNSPSANGGNPFLFASESYELRSCESWWTWIGSRDPFAQDRLESIRRILLHVPTRELSRRVRVARDDRDTG